MNSALRLPGNIPGLLQPCSPVLVRMPKTCRLCSGFIRSARRLDNGNWRVWIEDDLFGVLGAPLADIFLDLSVKTGCAHAAWWAEARRNRIGATSDEIQAIWDAERGIATPEQAQTLACFVLRLAALEAPIADNHAQPAE